MPHTSDTSCPEDRLDTLETRIAHQDATIDELNATVTAQWKMIDRLERQVAALIERAEADAAADTTTPANKPPPHY